MHTFALRWLAILGLSVLLSAPVAARAKQQPAPGEPRSIGSYTSGCIQGAQTLPSRGPGFQTVRRSRSRYFGHPTLVQYLQELGDIMESEGLGVLNIGDLGEARGGPMPSAHSSHQTGLDADVWFWLQPKSEPMSKSELETAQPPSMVADGRLALNPKRWTSRQLRLMEAAAGFDSVARIFVTPPVKQALCKAFPGAAWLRKIRPWWGHQAHFHVRLRCPLNDAACVNQPPPQGDECGDALAWWFTDEAKKPPRGKSKPSPLPKACQIMLAK